MDYSQFTPNPQDMLYQSAPYTYPKRQNVAWYVDEHFAPYPPVPRYLVSTYGRVYDTVTGRLCMEHLSTPDSGYPIVAINNPVTGRTSQYVHRMVMMAHCPIPNPDEMVVNHLDLNKTHNTYFGPDDPRTNLEWTTQAGNSQHARDHGAGPIGENVHTAVHNNEQIEAICKLLQENPKMRAPQIAEELGLEYRSSFKGMVSSIRHHKGWKNVGRNYDIQPLQQDTDPAVIYKICDMITKGYKAPAIAKEVGVTYDNNFASLVSKTKFGKIHTDISRQYGIIPYNQR